MHLKRLWKTTADWEAEEAIQLNITMTEIRTVELV